MDPGRSKNSKGLLETILRKIPGYGGYLTASERRESESQARRWVANQLELAKKAIDQFAMQLANQGRLETLPTCDRLRGRLDLMIARLRGAPARSGGFWDADHISDDQLADLYEYDLWLIDESEKFAKDLAAIPLSDASAEQPLQVLERKVAEMEAKWQNRQRLLESER